ncbi:MAG TPA: polysaccharide deacetylase family protein, partial [Bacteroidota bacterium]
DPRDLWQQGSARTRLFPSRYERAPYELVAAAGRADLLRLIHCALEYLHHLRALPYARLWPFPDAVPSVLAFRLDTDRASRSRIDAFAQLSSDLGIPFTWFIDTASHDGWLERFAAMQGQEIGVHCYRHRSFTAPEGYITDIHEARRRLNAVGLAVEAYAAPFGIWNPALGEALEGLEVPYSSEFGIGYDTLPFYPEIPGRRYSTLQVPVHPISPGALRRVGYSPGKMEAYYADLLVRKIARAQPLFLYDHPIHGYAELGRTVLAEALRAGARPVTLGGFARWWRRRAAVLHVGDKAIAADGLSLHLSTPGGESFVPLVPREGQSPAPQGEGPTRSRALFHAPEGIRDTREFDLRTTIGAAFQAMSRRRQR